MVEVLLHHIIRECAGTPAYISLVPSPNFHVTSMGLVMQ